MNNPYEVKIVKEHSTEYFILREGDTVIIKKIDGKIKTARDSPQLRAIFDEVVNDPSC